jgi:hypothetical protein
LASHYGLLDAHGALLEIDVRPVQCNPFGWPEACEEGGREVIDDLGVFPLGQVVENRFDLRQGEWIGRWLLHWGILDRRGRIAADCAVAPRELEHST